MDRKYQSTAATAPQHSKQQQMSNLFTKLVCKKEQMGIQKQLVK